MVGADGELAAALAWGTGVVGLAAFLRRALLGRRRLGGAGWVAAC